MIRAHHTRGAAAGELAEARGCVEAGHGDCAWQLVVGTSFLEAKVRELSVDEADAGWPPAATR